MSIRQTGRAILARRLTLALAGLLLATGLLVTFIGLAVLDAGWFRPFRLGRAHELFMVTVPASGSPTTQIPRQFIQRWRQSPGGLPAFATYSTYLGYVTIGGAQFPISGIRLSSEMSLIAGVDSLSTNLTETGVMLAGWWLRDYANGVGVPGTVSLDGRDVKVLGVVGTLESLPGAPAKPALYLVEPSERLPPGLVPPTGRERVLMRVQDSTQLGFIRDRLSRLANTDGQSDVPTFDLVPVASVAGAGLPAGPVYVAAVLATIVLALLTVGHLLYVEFRRRLHDIAMRFVLGSGNTRVFLSLVTELLVVIAIAIACGYWSASFVLHATLGDVQLLVNLPRPPAIPNDVVAGVALALGVVAALFAAGLTAYGRSLGVSTLRGRGVIQRVSDRRQKWLVGSQLFFGGCLVFVMGVALSVYSRLVSVEIGLKPWNVLEAVISVGRSKAASPQDLVATLDAITRDLESIPAVRGSAIADVVPFVATAPQVAAVLEDGAVVRAGTSRLIRASASYFDTLQLVVQPGRPFINGAPGPPTEAVVNRSFLSAYNVDHVLGKPLRLGESGPVVTIVGVADDARDWSVDMEATAAVYIPYSDPGYDRFMVTRGLLVWAGGNLPEVAQSVNAVLARYQGGTPFVAARPLAERMTTAYRVPELYAKAAFLTGSVAFVMAAGGALAVLAFVSGRKRRDLAIMTACGAGPRDIVHWHLRFVGIPVLLGLTAAGLAAMTIGRGAVTAVYGASVEGSLLPGWTALGGLAAVTLGFACWRAYYTAKTLDSALSGVPD